MSGDVEVQEFVNTGYKYSNRIKRTIRHELSKYNFPEEILIESDNIYQQLNINIKRKDNRLMLKFFLIYNAYINLNRVNDPLKLADIIGLDRNKINKVFKVFSSENTGYEIKDIQISPLDYIPIYYKESGLQYDGLEHLMKFAKQIIAKDRTLLEKSPQIVAAGMIIYYLKINCIKSSEHFIKSINRSENDMIKMINQIGNIDNS